MQWFFSIVNFFDSSCLLKALSLPLSYQFLYLTLLHFSIWCCSLHGSSWKNQGKCNKTLLNWNKLSYPVDTGRKLNVHKAFRRRPGRLLNVLCMFNLHPVSTGTRLSLPKKRWKFTNTTLIYSNFAFLCIASVSLNKDLYFPKNQKVSWTLIMCNYILCNYYGI